MNKKAYTIFIITGIIIIAILIAAIIYVLVSKPRPFIIVSDDGKAQLEIPRGALPDGINVSDLSVKRLSDDQAPLKEVAGQRLVGYLLEPDGLEFNKEVIFRVTSENFENSIPAMFQVTKNDVSAIDNLAVEIDVDANQVVTAAPITHFSEAWIAQGFFFVFLTVLDTPVGETVPVTTELRERSSRRIEAQRPLEPEVPTRFSFQNLISNLPEGVDVMGTDLRLRLVRKASLHSQGCFFAYSLRSRRLPIGISAKS